MRLLYNGNPLQLSHCAEPNNHYAGQPTLCTYEAFKNAVQSMIPQNYTQDCSKLETNWKTLEGNFSLIFAVNWSECNM